MFIRLALKPHRHIGIFTKKKLIILFSKQTIEITNANTNVFHSICE